MSSKWEHDPTAYTFCELCGNAVSKRHYVAHLRDHVESYQRLQEKAQQTLAAVLAAPAEKAGEQDESILNDIDSVLIANGSV